MQVANLMSFDKLLQDPGSCMLQSLTNCGGHIQTCMTKKLSVVPESVLFLFSRLPAPCGYGSKELRRVHLLAKQQGNDHSTCRRQKKMIIRDVHCDCHDWNQSVRASVAAQTEVHRHINK